MWLLTVARKQQHQQLMSLTSVRHGTVSVQLVITRNQPNSPDKMRNFTVEFLKCAKFHGKFTGPTAVISRCYVDAN